MYTKTEIIVSNYLATSYRKLNWLMRYQLKQKL